MTKRIQNLTKHTACPDEIFFQALIVNSPFKDSRTEDCGREVVWPGPKTLRMEDYDRLTASSSLFARKFDDSVDNQVLLHLARDHGFQIPRGIERLTADADLLTNTG